MTTAEKLYDLLNQKGIAVYHGPLGGIPAVTIRERDRYAVFLNPDSLTDSAQESDILSHEMGHIMTGSTHRADSPADLVERHEEKAERWAIRQMVPWEELNKAVASGIRTAWELAEYFNVTEKMIRRALEYYQIRGCRFEPEAERG